MESIREALDIKQKDWKNVEVYKVSCSLRIDKPFEPQIISSIDSANLTQEQWETERLLVVPPSISHAAILVMIEVWTRAGYLPQIVRIKRKSGSQPPVYVFAEILSLQEFRDKARGTR